MNLGCYADETPPGRVMLPGGAVLLTVPVPGAHSVALGCWVRRSTQDEPPGLGGLSHFIEHIVFKGSVNRSALEIAAGFDALGASVDAFTTKDNLAFTARVLPEYLPATAELLADMLLRPALDPEMIKLEQEVVCEEIQEARDTPEDHLHDAFEARLYESHPRALPILGTRESVMALDQATLRREHAALMCGPNLVVTLAGEVDERARDLVARLFDAPPPRQAAAPGSTPLNAGGAGRLDLRGPLVQSYFELGAAAVSLNHPDRVAIYLVANLLGGGMSSRVFQAVREREGLAYTVYIYTDLGRDTGLVSCAGSCSPAKMSRVEEVVRQEYARLIRDGADADELEANRAQLKAQTVFSLEGVMGQMGRAAKNEIYHGRFVPLTELVAELDAVDRDGVARAAELYFHPDRLVVATYGPA